ncbi:hypothetical protein [Fischerella sp. PCC 9605]
MASIISILKNPAYAGAFVYGRTRTLKRGFGFKSATTKAIANGRMENPSQ